jgi:hypothetical protein
LSNPQEPYQPGQRDAGPQQPPAPPQQPPAPHYGTPQYAEPQYAEPQYAGPHHAVPPQPQAAPQQGQYAVPGQNPAPGPFGLPGQRPPATSRRKLWIILGAIGGVLLLVIVGAVIIFNMVGGASNKAKGLAENFTNLVIAGESSKAYDDYLDPELQKQLTKEEFIDGVESLKMDGSCKPAYDELKVSSENGTNAADVAGLITCDGKEVELAYRFEGKDELKMINIKLKPKT